MRVVFINRFFFPDHSATSQMLSDLAFALAGHGHTVTVITSRLTYDDASIRLPARERIRGVEVIRIPTTGFGRRRLVGRSVDYLTFYLFAAWALLRTLGRGDIVVAKTDPPMLSVIAAPIAWLRSARHANWLQDIFPEVATALGMGDGGLRRALFALIKWPRDVSLRRADLNVVLGHRMAELVHSLGVEAARITIVPNWADGRLVQPVAPEANSLRRDWGLESDFVVGYSGNLGRAHDAAILIEAIARIERCEPPSGIAEGVDAGGGAPTDVQDRSRIRWLFIGGGTQMTALRTEVERRGLQRVLFRPYQPREKLSESLSVPDVHLISLRPELEGLIVPSKTYGIAAAGRASVFVGNSDGEISRMLIATETGSAAMTAEYLAQAVLDMVRDRKRTSEQGRRARQHFEAEYDLPIAVAKWEAALHGLKSK